MTTIRERYLESQEKEKEWMIRWQKEYDKKLGEGLNAALLNPKFIERATKILEEKGAVGFNDVEYLSRRGFIEYIKEAEKFWEEQGVKVSFSINSGLYVCNAGPVRGLSNSIYYYYHETNLYDKED